MGLYILGRRSVFESCYELREAFELLLQRPDKLTLVTGELWPSQRVLADEVGKEGLEGETVMEGVEHLGQYVFEMTKTRIEHLKEEGKQLPAPDESEAQVEVMAAEGEEGAEAVALAQPDEDEEEEEAMRVEGFEAEEE